MYHYSSIQEHIIAIPLPGDTVGLDVLLAATAHAREIAERLHIDLEDALTCSMRVEDWPSDGNPEHLVIRLRRDLERAGERAARIAAQKFS